MRSDAIKVDSHEYDRVKNLQIKFIKVNFKDKLINLKSKGHSEDEAIEIIIKSKEAPLGLVVMDAVDHRLVTIDEEPREYHILF